MTRKSEEAVVPAGLCLRSHTPPLRPVCLLEGSHQVQPQESGKLAVPLKEKSGSRRPHVECKENVWGQEIGPEIVRAYGPHHPEELVPYPIGSGEPLNVSEQAVQSQIWF